MKANRSALILGCVALGSLQFACSSSGSGSSNASGGAVGSGGSQSASGGALQSGGKANSGGIAGGGTSAGGSAPGGTSSSSSGGSQASGGAAHGGASSSGTGGATGGSSSGGAGVTGGTSGNNTGGAASGGGSSGGAANGGSGNTTPHGSAAKFNCEPGATYGSPTSGMGSVQQIMAPQSDYFAFIEGPVWISKVGTLFFSDNASSPSERIFKVAPPSTMAAVFVSMSGSNGLAIDNDNQILAADQRNKKLVRFDSTSGKAVGTAISTGSAKPNDVLVRSDGTIYFTDPDSGFYQVSAAGVVSAAMKPTQGARPNGIELSPDENTLYVGDVGNKTITKYAVKSDGSVDTASAAMFVAQTKSDTVDGMCVDCAGNVYAGTSNGVEIYSPSGTYIATVPTGESSNCTFGGTDRKTMYVTSRAVLKYVTLGVPGLPD